MPISNSLRLPAIALSLAGALACITATTSPAAETTCEFRVVIDGSATAWNRFGLRNGALPGVDAFDMPAPPPPPGFPFDAYLVMPGSPAGLPNRWFGEFRPTHDGSIEVVDLWEFAVASPEIGALCRIEVRPVSPVSYGDQLSLLPPTGGSCDMTMGGSFEFPLDAFPVSLWFELRTGSPVPVQQNTWGSVKTLFRR